MKKRILSFILAFVFVAGSVSFLPETDFSFSSSAEESAKTDPSDEFNIAYMKPTRSNSVTGKHANAVDGDTKTQWEGRNYPKYVDIDLKANYKLSEIIIFTTPTLECFYKIYGSRDGISFERIYASETYESAPAKSGLKIRIGSDGEYRIVRVNITGIASGGSARLGEVRIHGELSDTPVTPTREKIEMTSYSEWLKNYAGVDLDGISDKNGHYDIDKTYTKQDTVKELEGLVTRILGEEYVSWFSFNVADDPDKKGMSYFRIEDSDGKIKISGATGCDIASGLNHYLKYYCNVSVSQETKQTNMPQSIVKVGKAVTKDTKLTLRYAYNYCTLSYTMPFFGYDDWRRELDFLFLNGVNLILDTTATEALWVYYLQSLGYSADDAKNYVCGYAYKAWWLMGNLEGYGGNVSDSWVLDTLEMARQNQRYMTVMGAQPALQTFVGAMPETFGTLAKDHLLSKGYSDVSKALASQGTWSGETRPNVLRTDYDGYTYLARLFYDSQNYIYGEITDYYCGDVCHEGGIIPSGLKKEDMSKRILNELLDSDKDGQWILQRWWDNPMPEILNGFGTKRKTNVIVIDLSSAQNSAKWTDTKTYGSKEFGGTQWIFSSLDNYGGRPTMHGELKKICGKIIDAKKNSKYLKGMGITPEGTQNNPVFQDLYWEMVWNDEIPDLDEWIKSYCLRRYGGESKKIESAWEKFIKSVYMSPTIEGASVLTSSGHLPRFDFSGGYYDAPYSDTIFFSGLKSFCEAFDDFSDSECYIYDLVELLQTYLENTATDYINTLRTYAANPSDENTEKYRILVDRYIDCLMLIDEVSSYSENQLLGKWMGRAYDWIDDSRTGEYDDFDCDMMTFNAKALISSWFTTGSLIDYANRLYSGLVEDYYLVSWNAFFISTDRLVKLGKPFSTHQLTDAKRLRYAVDFINNGKTYTDTPSDANGDKTSRGLGVIIDYIMLNHNKVTRSSGELIKIGLAEKSKCSLSGGKLNGLSGSATVSDLINELVTPEGYTLCVPESDGNDGYVLMPGDRIEMRSESGKLTDLLLVGGYEKKSTEVDPADVTPLDTTDETPLNTADQTDDRDGSDNTTIILIVAAVTVCAGVAAAVAVIAVRKKKKAQ